MWDLHRVRQPAALLALSATLVAACAGPFARTAVTPTPPATGIVGQRIEFANVGLSVNSVTQLDQIGDFFRPSPGDVFVVVNVTINNKRPYQIPYSPYDFSITDRAGNTYEAGVTAGSQPLQRSTLDATKDATGNVNFDIPSDAEGLTLAYRVPGTTGAITVDLGGVQSIPTPVPTPQATPTPAPTVGPTNTPLRVEETPGAP
ncbi:MAG TPA: DUF4352 domain-containing protein [Chloroflexota bacterium]|nr:DUF4352 domain-containing protein [Chloroflexota bacterium]